MEISQEEINWLNIVTQKIEEKIATTEQTNKRLLESLKDNMKYMWDSIYEMDSQEKAFVKNQMAMLDETQQENIKELMSYKASLKSPYFGAIDFDSNEEGFLSYKIGLKGIKDGSTIYVVDWRAPFSELYYNYDVGYGEYFTGLNKVTGNIKSKKQYKIENGKIIFCIESDIKIDDQILQEVLAKTASEKMKNIVSTIQKEQNAIIRKETSNNLIVQGVAGSGKTSIALHRIAYLLYKHRKTLSSSSVLIISPNKFFSDYISNVLPELGEQNIAETVMDQILKEELNIKYKIETKSEQVERLLGDQFAIKICEIKNSMQFCEDIEKFCNEYFDEIFNPTDIVYENFLICNKETLKEMFLNKYKNRPVYLKLNWIKDYVSYKAQEFELKLNKSTLEKFFKPMFGKLDIYEVYNEFLKRYYNLNFIKSAKIKFEDAIALLYIKQYIYGYTTFNNIKHLLIDEFQDYSPLNYKIINNMFPCVKTILGDMSQDVSGSQTKILENFNKLDSRESELITLNKSYRSSYEITTFANKIINRTNVDIVQRHGKNIQIVKYNNIQQKINYIKRSIEEFKAENFKTIGILTKSIKLAQELNELLKDKLEYNYLTIDTTQFEDGVMLAPTFLVKGLEFDAVIVVDTNDENFNTEIDKQALYVACTRAMHELRLMYSNNLTKFIKRAN